MTKKISIIMFIITIIISITINVTILILLFNGLYNQENKQNTTGAQIVSMCVNGYLHVYVITLDNNVQLLTVNNTECE